VIDSQSGQVMAESADLSSEASMQSQFQVSIPTNAPFVRLRLLYHRSLGTTRIRGMLVIEWVKIEAQPQ